MPKFIIALIIFFLILKVIAVIFEVIAVIILPIGYIVIILGSIFLIYKIYVNLYFNSKKFKKIKDSIQDYIINCNELNSHIEELKCSFLNIKSYDYGEGQLYDNSVYNIKRREWSKNIKNNLTHYCSATVCTNASNQPFKYLCKYFSIKTNEETLSNFETILNNFAAAEQGKILLQNEKELILENIKNLIPSLIYSFDKNKLVTKLGFENVDMSDLYFPIYKFQYISAGGNSSSYCDIKLNVENLDKFVNYMNDLVNFKKVSKDKEH